MSAEVIKPLEGEEGSIPSVAAPKPASNTGRNVAIIGGIVVALGAVGFGVAHFMRHTDVEVADAKALNQSSANAQPIPLKMPLFGGVLIRLGEGDMQAPWSWSKFAATGASIAPSNPFALRRAVVSQRTPLIGAAIRPDRGAW